MTRLLRKLSLARSGMEAQKKAEAEFAKLEAQAELDDKVQEIKSRAKSFADTKLQDASLGIAVGKLLDQWHLLILEATEICTVKFLKTLLKRQIIWVLLLVAVGLMLHEARNVFYYASPHIIKHSHTFVIFVNAMSFDLYVTVDAIKLMTRAIEEALHFLSAGRFPHDMPKFRGFDEPKMLNASSLRQTLKETTTSCEDLRTGWTTLETFIRAQTSDSVCPVLRAATPCGRAGQALQYVGQPFSYDADPQGNNCKEGDYDLNMAITCLSVNSGMVILEVVVPVLLAVIILKSYLGVVLKFAWLVVKTAFMAARLALALVALQI